VHVHDDLNDIEYSTAMQLQTREITDEQMKAVVVTAVISPGRRIRKILMSEAAQQAQRVGSLL
jgi:hypothetical protein